MHECGSYGVLRAPETIELVHSGRMITLISPFELDPNTVVSSTLCFVGNLLYFFAKEPSGYKDPPCEGLLIVASRRDVDRYAIVVWHHVSGWALNYLRADDTGASAEL